MARLALETCAVVRATLPQAQEQQAALMLRMWHRLPADADRDMLFASFDRAGTGPTLVAALLDAVTRLEAGRRAPRIPALAKEHCSHCDLLREAFLGALADTLGTRATPMVLNAWRQLLDTFFRDTCAHEGLAGRQASS